MRTFQGQYVCAVSSISITPGGGLALLDIPLADDLVRLCHNTSLTQCHNTSVIRTAQLTNSLQAFCLLCPCSHLSTCMAPIFHFMLPWEHDHTHLGRTLTHAIAHSSCGTHNTHSCPMLLAVRSSRPVRTFSFSFLVLVAGTGTPSLCTRQGGHQHNARQQQPSHLHATAQMASASPSHTLSSVGKGERTLIIQPVTLHAMFLACAGEPGH